MKKIVLAAFAAAVAVPVAAAPGDTATATGEAVAEIVAPISIVHDEGASLNFGVIVAGTVGGTVVVDTSGAPTPSADLVFAVESTTSADSFTVSGDPGRNFSIDLADSTVASGTNSMDFSPSADSTSAALDATSGEYTLRVGGTLTVGADQPAGLYEGTYEVRVTYE